MRKIRTLKKNYEFKNVLSKGKFYIGEQISVYVLKNYQKINVIGIAVSIKCGAVKRNYIKRLIRENYRLIKDNLKQGYNIVFLWNKKREVDDANYHIIQSDMVKLLTRADLLNMYYKSLE